MNASVLSHQLSPEFLLASITQAEEFDAVFKDHPSHNLRRHCIVSPIPKKVCIKHLRNQLNFVNLKV